METQYFQLVPTGHRTAFVIMHSRDLLQIHALWDLSCRIKCKKGTSCTCRNLISTSLTSHFPPLLHCTIWASINCTFSPPPSSPLPSTFSLYHTTLTGLPSTEPPFPQTLYLYPVCTSVSGTYGLALFASIQSLLQYITWHSVNLHSTRPTS